MPKAMCSTVLSSASDRQAQAEIRRGQGCFRRWAHLLVDAEGHVQHGAVVGLGQVGAGGDQVQAGAHVVAHVHVLLQPAQLLHLQQQVHRLWLCTRAHVSWGGPCELGRWPCRHAGVL